MTKAPTYLIASLAAVGIVLALPTASEAQMDHGPKVEKTYGQGLPRDKDTLVFTDDQYPVWPLTPAQQQYAPINGARMKQHVVDLANVAIRYRDAGHKWWGRLPGTTADREGMGYMTREFESLGLKVEHFPFTIPQDWRPTDFSASYKTTDGATINLSTVFPVSGTKATPAEGITAEAIWVGIGSGADFIGRDVKGKAVIIYSTFVPGGRSHSASDRAGLFDSNTRAAKLGAAAIIDVMAVPGNGLFEPEGGVRDVLNFTVSQDEGFALKDRLENGEKVVMNLKLDVPPLRNVQTEYTVATLPGMSDEQIVVMTHTDGYFTAAMDNAAGMASTLELARFYASKPIAMRPRTMKFIQFPDHHHGETSLREHVDKQWPWARVAVKLTMEHPSQTLLYMYNASLTPTNAVGAFRWNALGSAEFEKMIFTTLKEFGVSVYAIEDGPKNGNFAPSFHIIDHIIYHTSLDAPELVPATGLERATRAFAAALDRSNKMTLAQLRGPNFPGKNGQGSLTGTQKSNTATGGLGRAKLLLTHMTPRFHTAWLRLAPGLLLAGLMIVPLSAQQPSAGNPYRAVENWAKLPAGMEWGQVSGVELDASGSLWVIHRAEPPILHFDASGNFLKAFGSGMFAQPHSLYFDREGNLWAVDGDGKDGIGQQIHKFSPDGTLLASLGTKGVAGDGPETFNRPCDIVLTASGDIFVVDGHINARVVKFSKDGRFLMSWGTKGSGPGELNTPHALAMDSSGRIFVGDRGNNRIQIFDQNGKLLYQWKQFGRPTGLFIDKNDTLYVADDESDPTRNPGFEPGVRVGSARTGVLTAFIPVTNTERAVADPQGNIYTAVLGGRTVRKYVRGN